MKKKKGLPEKSTKHVPKRQLGVGAVKNGKIRVKDGTTGKVSWRSGRSGMSADWDGDAISTNYNKRDMKQHKTHTVHAGRQSKKDIHHPGESSWKE